MRALLLVLVALPALAQDSAWRASVAAVAASSALDVHSSFGAYELNPIVGRGQFGSRQASISLGITAGVLVFEYLVVRKHPRFERTLTWTNFAVAGARAGTAARNYRLGGTQ